MRIARGKILATIQLLALALLLLGVSTAKPGPPPPGKAVEVRVMTYNIHAGIGSDGRLDLDRTADVIRDSGAEIVGLQEVDVHWSERSNFEDQAKLLAEKLKMRYFFAPIYSLDPLESGQPRREYGLAILSRYPILHPVNHEITRLSTQDPNPTPKPAPGFPEATLNVRGAKVHFYATHLDYRSEPSVRRMQVEDMLRIMDEDPEPKILVGDFNAEPYAPELAPLWEHFDDAWALKGSGPGHTFPASPPTRRIDYMLVSKRVEVRSVQVLNEPASDHLPVVADLLVSRGGV
ncbi:hypothetical protein Rxycam_02661 [Rubrobacter xylanophilus DSM 9941]|uniref:endonuclease/exonuclease/phosphatase family protein n=1 Tax=Rubrobacter xylanophilus TaxID=49319 RepID=UPI001C643EBA|nr:endonuclease/exonuclease/phosphatase family protein [Rubrobacter xylanophilus]QYJ16825.1 hypothetical protein Rxycam_02661 [Rubrobacter xylanophilus DSM 9941]